MIARDNKSVKTNRAQKGGPKTKNNLDHISVKKSLEQNRPEVKEDHQEKAGTGTERERVHDHVGGKL